MMTIQNGLPRPGNPDSELVETVAVVILLAVLVLALIASAAGQPGTRTRPRDAGAGAQPTPNLLDRHQPTPGATPTSFMG